MVKYKLKNGNILKDGHTMFLQDVVQDLKRKAYLEDLREKEAALSSLSSNGLASPSIAEDEISFKKEDVQIVAKALIEDAVMYDDGGDYRQDGYDCRECGGEMTVMREDFKHEIDCPVLVAQDLLTRAC